MGIKLYLVPKPVHLDAPRDEPRKRQRFQSQASYSGLSEQALITTSLLATQKAVSSFDSNPDIDRRLRELEQSHTPPTGAGISRFYVAQTTSNNPTEDDHAEAVLPVPSGYWSFFAIFDGHVGWETSAWLRDNLIPAVTGALADLYSNFHKESGLSQTSVPLPQDIEITFKNTFKSIDHDLVRSALDRFLSDPSRAKSMNALAPAWAGSCALVSFYDSHSKLLHTAITGDSRAVLGRRVLDDNGKTFYTVHLLSIEQDGKNPAEVARLLAEHPRENVVQQDRVLEIAVSCAFSDGRWK
ncbi:unnamed protein product [Somion occarium]|uniref:PPM-type phosphatase domain-containing protein n=1 Tax=Somion occarium TaxID=3059160 RepID=A0ABP1D5I6_9APHY